MNTLKDKLAEAIKAKDDDVTMFTWKFPRKSDGTQEEIKLIDATPEQLNKFNEHCISMLYSNDKLNPGRYILLQRIEEQREKCNVELFLRKLENGSICADKKPYPRHLYIQDLRAFINANRDSFPSDKLKTIPISSCSDGLPREFERIPIESVLDGALDQLGVLDTKHITFSFILNMGVCLTPEELKELGDTKGKSKLETIKEKLGIKNKVMLIVKPSGLSFSELRAMVNLRPKKYSELTTEQLTVLRNKVLFRLENKVQFHIEQWEKKMAEIKKVCDAKGIVLENNQNYANPVKG